MHGRRSAKETNPNYGQGRASLALDDDVLLDEEELTQRLLATFRGDSYRPPLLPSVATELLSLSQKPDVEIRDITALLEQDTMLTGRVMKLMRSPVYAGTAAVKSLHQAVLRLGLKTLCDLVLEVAMNLRVFRSKAYADTMERLRRHSTATAHLSNIICRYTAIEGDYAFLCGLLHDAGIAGTLIALSEGRGSKPPPDLIAIWPAVHRMHAEATAQMAKLWGLPPEVQLVLMAHHRVLIDGYPHPLAATVCLADEIAHELGLGILPTEKTEETSLELEQACLQSHTQIDRSSERTLACARESLRLTDPQLELIQRDAENLRDRLA